MVTYSQDSMKLSDYLSLTYQLPAYSCTAAAAWRTMLELHKMHTLTVLQERTMHNAATESGRT